MDRSDLERRLTALGTSVVDRLTDDQRTWLLEFIGAGEYGLALEMIADWLSEDELPISDSERSEAADLATAMGNYDRVMSPLGLCPRGA